MEPISQQRALDILEASLDLAGPERARMLDEAARADPEVGAELRRLEAALTAAPSLMSTDAGLGAAVPEAPAPDSIGVYRLMRLVGRGGMGAVYEGARADGLFEQRVAIKLLASRRWSADLEQRFVTERRILARLEQRNIARIFDGGVTPDGQSVIVMEFVDGLPITEHANSRQLDLPARLGLMMQLCGALQFAHQQLVVHADIKPSNVLVTADGSVKLLDFGIAQLMDRDVARGSERPAAGMSNSREPLTAAYAAPERRAGGAPSVACDVYSLGIVLRELLKSAVADSLPPPLSAVIDKATAADPLSRYGSVAALAADLARWSRKLPVSALKPTLAYRARLFVSRNRAAVGLGAITLCGLLAATVVSTRLYFAAERARAAEAMRFDDVRELNSFLVNVTSEQMLDRPGMVGAQRQTLNEARVRLERLAASRPDDARLQIELASDIARISNSAVLAAPEHADLRQVRADAAAAAARLAHLSPQAAALDGYWEVRAELAAIEANSALILDGNTAQAERSADQALSLAAEALRRHPNSADAQSADISARTLKAGALSGGGKPAEAIAILNATLQGRSFPTDPQLQHDPRVANLILAAQFQRCSIKRWQFADDDAMRECVALEQQLRRVIELQGPLVEHESNLAYTLFLVATLLPQPAQAQQSLAMLDEARDIYQRILHFGGNDALAGYLLLVQSARATTLAQLGRYDEARGSAQEVLQARRDRLALQPGNHSKQREVATALRRVGEVEQLAGRGAAACARFAEAGAIWDRMEREGTLLGFDLSPTSGHVPWIRRQLARCGTNAIARTTDAQPGAR